MTGGALVRGGAAVGLLAAALVAPLAVGGAESPVASVGGLLELPSAESPGDNVLTNGALRVGADGTIAGWNARAGATWQADPQGREGRPALKLTATAGQARAASLEQTVTLEPGMYTVEAWARTQALGDRAPRSGVRICLDARPRLNWWQCSPVARETTDWTLLRKASIAVQEPGPYKVTLGAYGAPDGTAWLDGVALTPMRKAALDVYLLYPNFRGMLFDDRPQILRVALQGRSGARVRLALVSEAGGAVARQQEVTLGAGAITAELDASGASGAPWRLRVELLDAAGGVAYRYPDHRIVRVPARVRDTFTAWVDEHNVTHLRGRPSFIIGLYTTSGYSSSRDTYARGQDGWGVARMAEAPVNMLINYHLGRAPVPALTTYMDELSQRGIYYLQTVNFYHRDDPQFREIDYPAAREGDEALNRWVARTLGAHPGLAGFYTADERAAEIVPKVFRQRLALAAGAPGALTYAVLGDGHERQAPLWRDAVDVLGLDPYPVTKPAGQNPLAVVGEWTRIGQDAVKRSRPLWMVMQYFPLTAAGGWPSQADLKTMSWMAIVDGARGLFYWSYGAKGLAWVKDPQQRAAKWNELVQITREIKALEPVLLAPDAEVARPSVASVRALGKRMPDGARYLFAYNTAAAPATVSWTLAAPAQSVIDLDAKAPGPPVEGTGFRSALGPYEVKRWLIR